VVGGPPERGAQIRQLDGEPGVRLGLARAVPEREDGGFAAGEIAGMCGPDLARLSAGGQSLVTELADGLQDRVSGALGRPISHG
jgi:hypothetical protein